MIEQGMHKLFEDASQPKRKIKDNEWWTPKKYIKAAEAVMGGIDCDPASCEQANQTIRATTYYTKEQNGLLQDWYGRVWLNPPYSCEIMAKGMQWGNMPRSLMHAWINKLIAEYRTGNVEQAILLTKADPKQIWFQPLFEYLICFAEDRIYFNRPGCEPARMMFGTCFVYLGPNEQRFIEVFSQFGAVVRRVSTSRSPMQTLWENSDARHVG